MEAYARRLLGALRGVESLRMTIFAAGAAAAEDWGADVVTVRVDPRSRARRALAEQTLLPRTLRRLRPDLLHNAFNTAPAVPGVPQVTSIHDVIFKRHPETHGLLARGVELLVPLAARRSLRVVTGSESSRADIVRFLRVPAERVDVAPYGPGLEEPADPLAAADVRDRLGLGDGPLVLTVAARLPHKNLGRLIDALARVPDATFVVPGYATAHDVTLASRAARVGVQERLRLLPWLDDRMLDGLYRAADCFVLPSLAEGFGLPVLDAMARGVPVACSNRTSLPEVAGDAALLSDPTDVDGIATALRELLGNAVTRERLRRDGPAQAAKFSWSRTAELTLATYERAVASTRS